MQLILYRFKQNSNHIYQIRIELLKFQIVDVPTFSYTRAPMAGPSMPAEIQNRNIKGSTVISLSGPFHDGNPLSISSAVHLHLDSKKYMYMVNHKKHSQINSHTLTK